MWSRDGKQIFYREYLMLMAVEVNPKGGAVELGAPKALFEVASRNLAGRWYDIAPDGRFLMNAAAPRTPTQNFELMINWLSHLTK